MILFKKKLFVISGASGMTGSMLMDMLSTQGYVIGFDNLFCSEGLPPHPTEHSEFHVWDICYDLGKLENLLIRYDAKQYTMCFINCAAIVHTKHFYDVNHTFNVNVLGMKAFLDLAIKYKAQFVNCSTSEVYSMQSYKPGGVLENDALSFVTAETTNRTSYATGKLLTEFFAKDAYEKYGIPTCSIRFANVYSEKELESDHIIPFITDALLREGHVKLLKNARNTRRTFLHNYDSCMSVMHLIGAVEYENLVPFACNTMDGSVYNVGTNVEYYIHELAEMIRAEILKQTNGMLAYEKAQFALDALGLDEKCYEFQELSREADPERRLLNCEKIMHRTEWKPKMYLQSGIVLVVKERIKRTIDKNSLYN